MVTWDQTFLWVQIAFLVWVFSSALSYKISQDVSLKPALLLSKLGILTGFVVSRSSLAEEGFVTVGCPLSAQLTTAGHLVCNTWVIKQ